MTQLGQMLRDARESKGISLAEAEEATRIRRKYLQALEEADYDVLPPSVYSRGFLRSYATYLGLDPKEALAAFQDGAQTHTELREPQIISEPLVPGSSVNWEFVAGVLMLIAVGVILVLVYRQYIAPLATQGTSPPPTVVEEAALVPVNTPALAVGDIFTATPTIRATSTPPPPTPPPPTPTATRTRRPTPTRTPPPVHAQELTLSLRVTARSWIRVVADGETVFEGTVVPGDERTWKARREINLRTGNAGGVIVTLNGRELGVLGKSGQVLEYVWRLSETGQVLMATPTP
jgi:cytoskeletal protein RodZ